MDVLGDSDDLILSQALESFENFDELDEKDVEFGNFTFDVDEFLKELEKQDNIKTEQYDVRTDPPERFGKPVNSTEIKELHKSQESTNTRRNTSWGVKVFDDWRKSRNANSGLEMQLPDLLSCSSQDLDHILSCFVIECRRADGSPYPPKTFYQLCAAILRFMRDNEIDLNFLDGKDMRFRNFRKTLDARMKQLATEGIGVTIRQADPISPEMENALWEGGHLGMKTSVALTNTIFFYNCKLFGLRGLDEHRSLVTEQFKLDKISDKMFITFYGRTSKNFAGGLNQRNLTAKEVKHDCGPDGPRNLFHVYQTYIDMVGPGSMYRRPLAGEGLKYSKQVMGVNKLGKIIKDMCSGAGFHGNFSNYSGKRTCATNLFQSGIEEQLVMSRTGHRSTAVRNYKRPSQEQLSAVSMALNPPKLGSEENECAAEFEANNSKLPKLMVDPMRTPMINITNCNVHIFDAGNK